MTFLGEGVKTYSAPLTYFQGVKSPKPPRIYASGNERVTRCDILGEGSKHTLTPFTYFQGVKSPPNLPGSTPLVMKECGILGEGSKHTLTLLHIFRGSRAPQTSQVYTSDTTFACVYVCVCVSRVPEKSQQQVIVDDDDDDGDDDDDDSWKFVSLNIIGNFCSLDTICLFLSSFLIAERY